jgi:hypothetical protein
MPAAISEAVIDKVKEEWAIDPEASAREVARRFQSKYGPGLVGDRTIQTAVAQAKAQAPQKTFPCTPWRPRGDPEENPEEALFLLEIHQQKRREGGKGLLCHEAAWARRLRHTLDGLGPPWRVLELIKAYAERERAAYYLNTTPYTEDLDGFVTFRMWLSPAHQQRYEEAIAVGAVPVPFLGTTEPFLKELLARGPAEIGEEVWDRLSYNAIFWVFKQLSTPSDHLPAGWSNILLKYLDDPQSYEALISPTTAATKDGAL